MISAPNLRLPLNGSRWLVFFCVSIFFFSSCGLFRKAPKEPRERDDKEEVLDPIEGKTSRPDDVTNDTITPLDSLENVVIDSLEMGRDTQQLEILDTFKRSIYRVTYLLPFLTDRFDYLNDKIDEKSLLALNFYEGAKLAIDSLSQTGPTLEISVMDSRASTSYVQDLLDDPRIRDAHVIIGPARSSVVNMVADYAKEKGIILFSPFTPRTDITLENPYYIQLKPSLAAHCKGITKHVLDRFDPAQVSLVCRDKPAEVERFNYFQEAQKKYFMDPEVAPFNEIIIPDDTEGFQEMDLSPYILGDTTSVFVVPSWSSQAFVYSFLRQLNISRMESNVVVYGMPQWMEYDLPNFDIYENLNVHVSSSTYFDPYDPKIKRFKQQFYLNFGMPPTEHAFVGYDITLMVGDLLNKHGLYLINILDQMDQQYLHTFFNFERVPLETDEPLEDFSRFKQYENVYINILEFEDYYFQKRN